MNTLTVQSTGYYDTAHEYKVMLLHAGDVLTIADSQPDAPCKGKRGNGVWCEATGWRQVCTHSQLYDIADARSR